jgi:hypothetical protein
MRMDRLVTGQTSRPFLNTHFTRFHEVAEDYNDFHDDYDDHNLFTTDNFERLKPFTADKKNVVGTTPVVPLDDNDELLHFYDIQGESLYTNPPDPNMLFVDHGLEEDKVWAFRMTGYNQQVISNPYKNNFYRALSQSNVPFWTGKLMTPSFYRDDKYEKFLKQWDYRLGLENIKIKHALVPNYGDAQTIRSEYNEIYEYLNWVQAEQNKEELKNVYVTDHKFKAPKLNTLNEDEDVDFYNYQQSLNDYQKTSDPVRVSQFESGRYERGTLLQKIFEPLAGARRNDDGTLVFQMTDKDFKY